LARPATILLLFAAAAPQPGAQVLATASARIVEAERITFADPTPAQGRLRTEQLRRFEPGGEPVTLRLVEFQ
jgi:hypothetical protein